MRKIKFEIRKLPDARKRGRPTKGKTWGAVANQSDAEIERKMQEARELWNKERQIRKIYK